MMKVVFIAGPYRADTAWGIERNIRLAEDAALQCAQEGWVPLCPHTMFRYFHGTLTDDFWLEAIRQLLLRCDAILIVGQWQGSAGSMAEYHLAKARRIPVVHSIADLRKISGNN